MYDQEQDFEQESDQQSPIEEDFTPSEGYLNRRLSLLHLDHRSMASTDAVSDHAAGADDSVSYQVEVASPAPPLPANGKNTPLKRRSPSSSFTPPPQLQPAGTGYWRMISEGYRVLQLPGADNERASTVQQHAQFIRRCSSLISNGNNPIPSAEISNSGTLPENQTRRSLFNAPANGSAATAHMLPPPHPLARTASDPLRFSSLEINPPLTIRERNSSPRTDPYSHCGLLGNGSELDSTQESSSSKRLRRMARARKIKKKMKKLIDEMVDGNAEPINCSTPESDLIPTDHKMLDDQVGSYNNRVSSTEETITYAQSDEVPQEELFDKEMKEEDMEAEAETVRARREGDCTFLEFKCRCGSGYSVGIIGQSCFYKLI